MAKEPTGFTLQKGLSLFAQIAGAIGIIYGAATWMHNRENRINNAVTQKEMLEIVSEIKSDMTKIKTASDNTYYKTDQLANKVDNLNANVGVLKDELIIHIKKEPDIPNQQKIDDILRIVKSMSEQPPRKQTDTMEFKIGIKKIEKTNGQKQK